MRDETRPDFLYDRVQTLLSGDRRGERGEVSLPIFYGTAGLQYT